MVEGEIEIRWCNERTVCPLDPARNYFDGSDPEAMHEVCRIVHRCRASLCTRIEVEDNRGREKLVEEKESHIELSGVGQPLSLSSHTHTHDTCPDCKTKTLVQSKTEPIYFDCTSCLNEYCLLEMWGER